LDFDAFVCLIRRIIEWRVGASRSHERVYAAKELKFSEAQVNHYRVVFDVYDTEGGGRVDILGVRKMLGFLKKNVNSDQLRLLIDRIDTSGSGCITFVDFLRLVYKLDEIGEQQRHM